MPETLDAIVIGAGQSGPALAVRCGKEGLKTAIVERHRFGGTCVNNGCIPTKTLVASARAALKNAPECGPREVGPVRQQLPTRARTMRGVARRGSTLEMTGID